MEYEEKKSHDVQLYKSSIQNNQVSCDIYK